MLWLIGFAAFICCLGVGPALALSQLNPTRGGCVTQPADRNGRTHPHRCSLAATLIAGDATFANSTILIAVALAIGCLASLKAIVSSGRGIHALQST